MLNLLKWFSMYIDKKKIFISRSIIIFSIFWIPLFWYYNFITNNLYWNFFFIWNVMWFLWDLSWWSVVIVMISRPLFTLFPKVWLFRKLIFYRKSLWILSSSIVVTVLFWNFLSDSNIFINYFSTIKWGLYHPLIARLSEITWIILLLTSNIYSQKKLWLWWKKLHRLSYVYFISGWLIAWIYSPFKVYPVLLLVIFIWIIAQYKIIKRKK